MQRQGHEKNPNANDGRQTPQQNGGVVDIDASLEARTVTSNQQGSTNSSMISPPDLESGKKTETQQSNINTSTRITQEQPVGGHAQPAVIPTASLNLNTSHHSNSSQKSVPQSQSPRTASAPFQSSIIRTQRGLEVNFKTVTLPQDVYSIGYLAPRYSWPFWYAFIVFGIQASILWLAFLDLIEDHPGQQDQNHWNVPREVSTEVFIAQYLALLVAVLSQDDVTTSLFFISVGVGPRYPEFQTALQIKYPGKGSATFVRFWVTNLLRFLEGLSTILVSFVFIIQSETVLDIFLNFAALQFVADLDNLGFRLALEGWFGVPIQFLTKEIRHERIPIKKAKGLIDYSFQILLFMLVAILFCMNAVTVRHQLTGNYIERDACFVMHVLFGPEVYRFPKNTAFQTLDDANNPLGMQLLNNSQRLILNYNTSTHPLTLHYSYFSGTYQADFDDKAGIDDKRPVYYEASRIEGMDYQQQNRNGSRVWTTNNIEQIDYQQYRKDSSIGMFYYCAKEYAWVWTVRAFVDAGAVPKATLVEAGDTDEERCKYGWLMKSPVTRAVVLDEVPKAGWKVWTGTLSDASSLSISCLECKVDGDCGLVGGTCTEMDNESTKKRVLRSSHVSRVCKCNEDAAGDFCTERQPCQQLIRFTEKGEYGSYSKTDSFSYGRPVYSFAGPFDREEVEEGAVEEVKYTGRQWTAEMIPAHLVAAGLEGINRDRHAFWSGAFYDSSQYEHHYYYSAPTNNFLPTGSLQWYVVDETGSEGDYGPRGREIQVQDRYSCWSLDCSASADLCGKYGKCTPDAVLTLRNEPRNLKGGKCVCNAGYYGHFCEFKMPDEEL